MQLKLMHTRVCGNRDSPAVLKRAAVIHLKLFEKLLKRFALRVSSKLLHEELTRCVPMLRPGLNVDGDCFGTNRHDSVLRQ